MFCVRVQVKGEAHLVEVALVDELKPIGSALRSRGCYVIYHVKASQVFLWYGSRCTKSLKRSGTVAARMLQDR